jgi:hypothetical protein
MRSRRVIARADARVVDRIKQAGLDVLMNRDEREEFRRKQLLVFAGMDIDARAVAGYLEKHAAMLPMVLRRMREEAPETGIDPDDVPVELLVQGGAQAIAEQAFLFGWELAQEGRS